MKRFLRWLHALRLARAEHRLLALACELVWFPKSLAERNARAAAIESARRDVARLKA